MAPGIKMTFVRVPAGQFVMGSYRGQSDTRPTAKVKIDKAFWMGELEVTNQQFNVIFPGHDSRFVDQQWKDHVVQGYPANKPEQPVIRVSYNDAMDYCKKLSEKTGLNITLPTEAQWEWACRAGSDQDFWYGDMNADFGKKDNLADVTTLLLAVSGIDPQPMPKTSPSRQTLNSERPNYSSHLTWRKNKQSPSLNRSTSGQHLITRIQLSKQP